MTDEPKKERPEEPQASLFAKGEWWDESWQGMPEFVQKDLTPFKTIYVHFETREDMDAFARLVDQTITLNTRSIWYPEAEIGHFADRRYVDAPPAPDAVAPSEDELREN